MTDLVESIDCFNPVLGAYVLRSCKSWAVKTPSIVINLAASSALCEGEKIAQNESRVLNSVELQDVRCAVVVPITLKPRLDPPSGLERSIRLSWTPASDLFPSAQLRDVPLWASEKHSLGNGVSVNLWFAPRGTHCGIHKLHDFREWHVQVYGVGRMQKFHERDESIPFEEVLLAPGSCHRPFFNERLEYPWHQYYADTDCVWLAIECKRQTA